MLMHPLCPSRHATLHTVAALPNLHRTTVQLRRSTAARNVSVVDRGYSEGKEDRAQNINTPDAHNATASSDLRQQCPVTSLEHT